MGVPPARRKSAPARLSAWRGACWAILAETREILGAAPPQHRHARGRERPRPLRRPTCTHASSAPTATAAACRGGGCVLRACVRGRGARVGVVVGLTTTTLLRRRGRRRRGRRRGRPRLRERGGGGAAAACAAGGGGLNWCPPHADAAEPLLLLLVERSARLVQDLVFMRTHWARGRVTIRAAAAGK